MQTFESRPATTGVMLAGEKGSGKTLLAKSLAVACANKGIPTIIINTDWHGEKFNTLMQSIQQPCMILFDEFEKVYDRDTQPAILTLLDGVFPSKKLFVLTCNDKWRIDEHMRNRPGRIFYMLEFKGLSPEFITEYCNDNLNDKEQIDNILKLSSLFSEFNFDMLQALCEEMNRYNETAQQAIKMLNAKPQTDDSGTFKVKLKINGIEVPEDSFHPTEWRGNPLSKEKFALDYYGNDDDTDISSALGLSREPATVTAVPTAPAALPDKANCSFTYLDLKKVDANSGTFTYVNDSGTVVTFTRVRSNYMEYNVF